MRPWNPYAQTFHGEPITGHTPVRVVVRGPEMTPQQASFLQATYASFVSGARLSIAPNPGAQGYLPDGSRYIIDCVNGVCTCVVWTAGGEALQEEVFSGILFPGAAVVIVNQGKVDAPDSKWAIKDMSSFPLSTNYVTANESAFFTAVPYRQGVSANTSVTFPGEEKYVYSSLWMGRYGNLTANPQYQVIGITEAKDALIVLENGAGRARIFLAGPIDLPRLFPPFGAEPDTLVSFDHADAIVTLAENSGTDPRTVFSAYSCSPSKNGRSIVYMERKMSDRTSPADIVAGKTFVKRPHECGASYSSYTGALYSTTGTVTLRSFKKAVARVLKSDRTGDTFAEGSVLHTVPDGEISSTDHEYAGYRMDYEALVIPHQDTSVTVTKKTAPKFVNSSRVENSAGGTYWYVVGDSVANGAISGAFNRSESTHDVLPHYIGNSLVLMKTVREFEYTETCTGTVDYRYLNGYFDWGQYAYSDPPPQSEIDLMMVAEARDVTRTTDQQITVSMGSSSYVVLNNGEKLYTNRDKYEEDSTFYSYQKNLRPKSGNPYDANDIEQNLQFDLTREDRTILVYDPGLDLLCYQEVTYSTTKSFSATTHGVTTPGGDVYSYTNSGGGALPVPPKVKIFIKCRNKTIVLERDFDTRDKRLLSLLPNVGISPYAEKDSSLLTSGGFAGWDVLTHSGLPGVVRRFNLARAWEETEDKLGDAQFRSFRGLVPSIDVHAPTVEYIKTPETGGAYLRLFVEQDGIRILDKAFLIDLTGAREANAVLPELDVATERGRPF